MRQVTGDVVPQEMNVIRMFQGSPKTHALVSCPQAWEELGNQRSSVAEMQVHERITFW